MKGFGTRPLIAYDRGFEAALSPPVFDGGERMISTTGKRSDAQTDAIPARVELVWALRDALQTAVTTMWDAS